MSKRNPAVPPVKVAQAERVHIPIADSLFADVLSDPATATIIRTNLRSWYLGAIGDEHGWGGPQHEQTRHYELLDELLAICTLNALDSESRFVPVSEPVSTFITDHFLDPATVLEIRRNLRVWFLVGVQTHEDNIGTVLEMQIEHYEVLDEVLTSLVEKRLPATADPR